MKRQRRREKNRASAQQSRQRKKHHLESLETRVAQLERDKAALQARVEALLHEGRSLRARAGPAALTAAGISLEPEPGSGERSASPGGGADGERGEADGEDLLEQLARTAQTLRGEGS